MQAASEGDLEMIKILIDYGADANAVNEDNERPVGFACAWTEWGTAELLLESGASVNALEDPDATYLDWATVSGHSVGIQLLRARGGLKYEEMLTS